MKAIAIATRELGTSDAELVERVLGGDDRAYAALVRRYRDRYVAFAVHMLGSPDEAEEALQEAFVRAHRSMGRCEERESILILAIPSASANVRNRTEIPEIQNGFPLSRE